LELHPYHRDIEEEMVAWAEAHLARPVEEGRRLSIFVFEYDTPRFRLLERRGYVKTPRWGVTHRLRIGKRPFLRKPWLRVTLFVRPVPTMAITKG